MSSIGIVGTGVVRVGSRPSHAEFERFAAEHGPRFVRLATLLTGSQQDAEDAVQEAMIALVMAWPRVRPETAAAYARAAVVRKAIDLVGRRRTGGEVPEEARLDPGLLRYEEDRAFFERLQMLPPQQRAVLVLRYYADYDDRTIGETLCCAPRTVRSQAARALAKLRAATAGQS